MNLIEFLGFWLIILVTFFIGYYVGKGKVEPESLQGLARQIIKKVKQQEVGAVNKPLVPEQLKKGTRLAQTEEAMEELLDQKIGK